MKIFNIENESGRLDKVMSLLEKDLSRMAIQRMIETGKILVNDKLQKPSYRVNRGDKIVLEEEVAEDIDLKPDPEIPLDIIYEDKDMLIINKQKGIVVHPGNGNTEGTLVNAIMARCKDSLSGIGGKIRPGIVHRIDKDTSGLIIVAKNDNAHINISKQIQERKVNKIYLALIRGEIKENSGTIVMPIARSITDRKKMAVNKNGKEAITHFKVLKRFKGYTLLELRIETGRTHQIRVHLAEIGFPIVGDKVYSNGKNPFNVEGQMLHAKSLEFIHPTNGEKVKFDAEPPKYFKDILNLLEKESSKC